MIADNVTICVKALLKLEAGGAMRKITIILTLLLSVVMCEHANAANDWVIGNVTTVEDYGGFDNGSYGVLISLTNQSYYNPSSTVVQNCTASRYRVVVGAEGVTEAIKNRLFAIALSAYFTGQKIRLFVNPDTGPLCEVMIGSIGDL